MLLAYLQALFPHDVYIIDFLFFLKSIRLINVRLCGGLEPLTEPSLGAVDPRENQLHTNCVRTELAVWKRKKKVEVIKTWYKPTPKVLHHASLHSTLLLPL